MSVVYVLVEDILRSYAFSVPTGFKFSGCNDVGYDCESAASRANHLRLTSSIKALSLTALVLHWAETKFNMDVRTDLSSSLGCY